MERHNLAHRNIKPSNILCDYSSRFYLTDAMTLIAPLARSDAKALNTSDDTIYRSPEVIALAEYRATQLAQNAMRLLDTEELQKEETSINWAKADAFSVAMVMIEVCTLSHNDAAAIRADMEDMYSVAINDRLQAIKEKYGRQLATMLGDMLKTSSAQRTSSGDLLPLYNEYTTQAQEFYSGGVDDFAEGGNE
jgi:hypothetical protein